MVANLVGTYAPSHPTKPRYWLGRHNRLSFDDYGYVDLGACPPGPALLYWPVALRLRDCRDRSDEPTIVLDRRFNSSGWLFHLCNSGVKNPADAKLDWFVARPHFASTLLVVPVCRRLAGRIASYHLAT